MKLIIASNNKNKIKEIKEILKNDFEQILSMSEAGIDHDTVEDGNTFCENALKKARELSEISDAVAIADDSGLCVDALDGAPGIYSARFCGRHGDDEANNLLLLQKMQGKENRNAHYSCAIALVYPDGKEICTEGQMHGVVLNEPRGNGGFGYDPLILIPQLDKTVAELTADEKNAISHRAEALKKLTEALK